MPKPSIYMVGDGGAIVKRKSGDGQDGVTQSDQHLGQSAQRLGRQRQTLYSPSETVARAFEAAPAGPKNPSEHQPDAYGVYAVDSSTIIAVGAAGTALRYKP